MSQRWQRREAPEPRWQQLSRSAVFVALVDVQPLWLFLFVCLFVIFIFLVTWGIWRKPSTPFCFAPQSVLNHCSIARLRYTTTLRLMEHIKVTSARMAGRKICAKHNTASTGHLLSSFLSAAPRLSRSHMQQTALYILSEPTWTSLASNQPPEAGRLLLDHLIYRRYCDEEIIKHTHHANQVVD